MVDHFHEQVIGLKKIGGDARAMVVTSGIERAIHTSTPFATISRSERANTKPSSLSRESTNTAA